MHKKSSTFLHYIFLIFIPIIFLVIFEAILDLVLPDMPYDLLEYDENRAYRLKEDFELTAMSGIFSPKECLNTKIKHFISTNSKHERIVPEVNKKPLKQIAVIGDSCSFGWDVSNNETFAYYLAQKLNENKFNVSVRNMAVPGYSSLEGFINYIKGTGQVPDIAIISFGANDEDNVLENSWRAGLTDYELHSFDEKYVGKVHKKIFLNMFFAKLRLTRLLYSGINKIFDNDLETKKDTKKLRMTESQTFNVMNIFISYLKSQKVKIIIHNLCSSSRSNILKKTALFNKVEFVDTNTPFFNNWRDNLPKNEITDLINSANAKFNSKCLKSFPEMYITTDDFHPNKYGNKIIANTLWPSVEKLLSNE